MSTSSALRIPSGAVSCLHTVLRDGSGGCSSRLPSRISAAGTSSTMFSCCGSSRRPSRQLLVRSPSFYFLPYAGRQAGWLRCVHKVFDARDVAHRRRSASGPKRKLTCHLWLGHDRGIKANVVVGILGAPWVAFLQSLCSPSSSVISGE